MRTEEYCSETHGGRGKGQVSLWLNSSGSFPVIGNIAINIMILTETRTAFALDFGDKRKQGFARSFLVRKLQCLHLKHWNGSSWDSV